MGSSLGSFEAAVLLVVARLGDAAYGVTVQSELEEHLQRTVSLAAVYKTLSRLAAKGLVSSTLGAPTAQRGGRAKRYFKLEALGHAALARNLAQIDALWRLAGSYSPS